MRYSLDIHIFAINGESKESATSVYVVSTIGDRLVSLRREEKGDGGVIWLSRLSL